MNNGNTLTIESSGSLTLGSSGDNKNLTTGNTAVINVLGELIIWGDLVVGNSLVLNVTGNLTINGDLDMGNGGDLTVDGMVDITGSFIGGNNTTLDVDGSLAVAGNFSVGNGSTATGTGSISVSGSCSDGSSSVCSSSVMPISLIYFEANVNENSVEMNWATASEDNNEYFSIERSKNGIEFSEIKRIPGAGNSNYRINYNYPDLNPIKGISYYRLSQTDYDGTRESFTIQVVEVYGSRDNFSLFPNPIKADESVTIMNSLNDEVSVVIINYLGDSIIEKRIHPGENTINFDRTIIHPGLYYIKMLSQTSEELEVKKLMVR